jgi:hypothetical protein
MSSARKISPLPLLPVEILDLSDVESVFHLIQTDNVDWAAFRAPFDLPDDCGKFN